MSFEQKTGSGHFSPAWVLTDDMGLAYTKWTIGCNSNYNELRAYVSDSISNKIDSVTFTSNSSLPKGWGKSCGIGYTEMYDSHIREHNGILYLNSYEMIYTSNNGGISWEKYDHMPQISTFSYIYDIQFNSKGWMYVATEMDGIFYTEDYQTWHQIGAGDATISVLSSLTYQGTIHSFYQPNGSSQDVQDIKVINDVIYFTVNSSPDPGIYSSQNWRKLNLNFKFSVNSYYLKSDGTFLIVSGDGVYYYN